MKKKLLSLAILLVIVLAACGSAKLDEPITLTKYNNDTVTFPTEKPVLFFFITTYT